MNKYQRLVITVAIIDLIVMILFPPFVERSLARHAFPSFDGFYFLLTEYGRRPIDAGLLSLELLWVSANALAAWLLLADRGNETTESKHAIGIATFTVINLAIIGLFPPFEQYSSLLRTTAPGFDSFYFLFGDRSARPIFTPLLYLEVFFILINALALYLLFNAVQRGEIAERHRQQETPDNSTVHLTPEAQAAAAPRSAALMTSLGRKEDRRHHTDPAYRGQERRSGHDRRHPE